MTGASETILFEKKWEGVDESAGFDLSAFLRDTAKTGGVLADAYRKAQAEYSRNEEHEAALAGLILTLRLIIKADLIRACDVKEATKGGKGNFFDRFQTWMTATEGFLLESILADCGALDSEKKWAF